MMTNQKQIDTPSSQGKFGWERIGTEGFAVPVIVRYNGVRYCPTRIVEQEIIKSYDNLPPEVFSCITLKSYYLTDTESKILNDINKFHTDQRYGNDFFTRRDVIISAGDVIELNRFLNITKEIITNGFTGEIKGNFGVIAFMFDPQITTSSTLIPFITKVYNNQLVRFVPSKLVERYANMDSATVKTQPSDWDIMYLKMLCIYCENKAETEITRDSHIVLLTDLTYIKTSSPLVYQDYDKIK